MVPCRPALCVGADQMTLSTDLSPPHPEDGREQVCSTQVRAPELPDGDLHPPVDHQGTYLRGKFKFFLNVIKGCADALMQ